MTREIILKRGDCRFERCFYHPKTSGSNRFHYFLKPICVKFMKKLIFLSVIILSIGLSFGCAPSAENTNNKTVNSNASVELKPEQMPEGLSGKPLETNGATPTPGIPSPSNANVAINPKGTPTPGIPSEKVLSKPNPKGTPPIPGIPDEATMKKQLSNSKLEIPPEFQQPGNAGKQK